MKKMNRKLKPFIASLFILIAVVFASIPSVGFAKNQEKEKDYRGNSAWSRFFDFFGIRANAATKVKVKGLVPSISGITAPTVLEEGEMGTWTVKASDPKNTALSYAVDWGDSDSKSLKMMDTKSAFVQTSTFTHAYAKEGEYKIKFTVSNESGLKTTSTVTVHVEEDEDSEDGPVISNLTAKSLKPRQATIRWTTDTRATSLVWYGTTSPRDTSKQPEVFRPAKIWNHKINLSQLKPDTKYYVIVGSSNKDGLTKSSEISFTTPALTDNVTPVITGLEGPSTIGVGETETVTVKAYDPKNSPLSYRVEWGDDSLLKTALSADSKPFVQTATFSHMYDNPGTYTATFTVQNEAGKNASSSMKITVTGDTTRPVISGAKATATGTSTATISWTTDEPSSSEVHYSKITPVDLNANTTISVTNESLTKEHSLDLTGLTANTVYYFLIESSDAEDNSSTSAELSFTTNS
ncbi:MAG: PKD domain-containing protein [Minisyncoccia bacterium]